MFIESDCIKCIRMIENQLVLELLDNTYIYLANTEIALVKDKNVTFVTITALD